MQVIVVYFTTYLLLLLCASSLGLLLELLWMSRVLLPAEVIYTLCLVIESFDAYSHTSATCVCVCVRVVGEMVVNVLLLTVDVS